MKKVKMIHEVDITYFCNAAGDAFWWDGDQVMDAKFEDGILVDKHILASLRKAYNNCWNECYGYPAYLATVKNKPYFLLVAEFGDLNDANTRDKDLMYKILRGGVNLANDPALTDAAVTFPEDTTTPFCQWELVVAIPAGKALTKEKIQDIAYAMDRHLFF